MCVPPSPHFGRSLSNPAAQLLTLEIFNHRFYKALDDTVCCDEMGENDTIVCFELPCHAQQSRTYKAEPDDPFILAVLPSETTPVRPSYNGRGSTVFGYPFVTVISQEQARHPEAIYEAIADRLQRWTVNARDLFTWVAGRSDEMEPVQIPISGPPMRDTVTEIKENGEVVTVEDPLPEEGDIVDEKATVVRETDEDAHMAAHDGIPRKVGFKRDLFRVRVQKGTQPFGVNSSSYAVRFDSWEDRTADAKGGVLLLPDDVLYIEFEDPQKNFYFGDEHSRWEYALWDRWEEFVHPELVASRLASSEKKKQGITLQDCLDEFTREEKLGEDDLWYCPRCKKHQQATKRFDLWKVPDVLVVHLKRFSNSRLLRDKIDAFVDFPTHGLDLTAMVGERTVGRRLAGQGVDVEALGLHDLEEPLMYDLFAVDEHMGGLGGGHYRAYALNHVTDKWYHFDDSYVTQSSAERAVVSSVKVSSVLTLFR